MPKSAQAFRTIREVADWLDVAAHVLRFWESKFNQIKPVKRAGGRRYYRPADMELVGGIKVLLHDRGLTIRGVQKLIADEGLEAVTSLSPSVDELLGDADVIDLDPSDEWDEDAAAEAEVVAEVEVQDPPVSEELPEVAAEDSSVSVEDTPPTDKDGADDATPEPVEGAPVDADEEPAANEADAPEATPASVDAAPEPAPSPAPTAHAPQPEPKSEPHPPRPSLPKANPAEGRLGALAALTQLAPEHRATLAPQIAALARLRDRMAAPHDPR